MKQININLIQKTNQEIDDLFWSEVKKAFAEDTCPEIYLNAKGVDFNQKGFVYLRKQVLILGQLQQAGATLH
jgi:hypothetical protein